MPGRIDDLLARLNEDPDKLHADQTPAVAALIAEGQAAIAAVLERMRGGDEPTRMRAQRVLEGITMAQLGFVPGQGWPDPGAEDRWRALWRSLGDFDWQAPSAQRERAIGLWQDWADECDEGDS
ncbi:MAG TPA: hypothetical protein VFV07_01775 [Rhizomicrobium sp.]|nr:hypothetical protein [Rhizomicrobium sp.]